LSRLSRSRIRRLTLAALALALAALAWTILDAAHAQAKRTGSALAQTSLAGELTRLPAEGMSSEAMLGFSVALSADGKTAIVGAPNNGGSGVGAAWVFTRVGDEWQQQAVLTGEEPGGTGLPCGEEKGLEGEVCGFGRSVSLSADGNVALVGSPRNKEHLGAAWVFTRAGSTWTRDQRLTGSGELGSAHFGRSVALSGDGTTAIVGGASDASGHGAAWVFASSGDEFTQQKKITAPPGSGEAFFGASVALSRNGNVAIVGGPGRNSSTGAAWVFNRTGVEWGAASAPLLGGDESSEEIGPGRFGFSVALSAEGTTALVGARTDDERRGAAWAFENAGGTWIQHGPKLTPGAETIEKRAFGYSVALSASGEEALIGAPVNAPGAAWLFKRSSTSYVQQGRMITDSQSPPLERLGASVALSQTGGEGLLGAPQSNGNTGAAVSLAAFAAPAPTVTRVTPASGPSAGGTQVTIEGRGFLPGATVTIGGEAAPVEFVSESELIARTSAQPAGSDEVTVSDESGTSSGGPLFTYLPPPSVKSVRPASGPEAGGTSVTVEGSGFLEGATVTIGSQATSVHVISSSKLTATTAATTAGADEVVVSDAGGTSSGGPTFTYEPPPKPLTALIVSPPTQQVLGTTTVFIAPPVLAVSGNVSPVTGKVYVRLPGTNKFVLLTGLLSIPFGTIVDAREGTVKVTTQGKKGLQSVNFYEGEFALTQISNGVATATLYGGSYGVCPTKRERGHVAAFASAHHSSRNHVVRKLWANGHGTYSTRGNYATGAVLGTVWETIDRCNGTGIRVVTDSVLVTNLVTHKKTRVKAGHTYIAKAP